MLRSKDLALLSAPVCPRTGTQFLDRRFPSSVAIPPVGPRNEQTNHYQPRAAQTPIVGFAIPPPQSTPCSGFQRTKLCPRDCKPVAKNTFARHSEAQRPSHRG